RLNTHSRNRFNVDRCSGFGARVNGSMRGGFNTTKSTRRWQARPSAESLGNGMKLRITCRGQSRKGHVVVFDEHTKVRTHAMWKVSSLKRNENYDLAAHSTTTCCSPPRHRGSP